MPHLLLNLHANRAFNFSCESLNDFLENNHDDIEIQYFSTEHESLLAINKIKLENAHVYILAVYEEIDSKRIVKSYDIFTGEQETALMQSIETKNKAYADQHKENKIKAAFTITMHNIFNSAAKTFLHKKAVNKLSTPQVTMDFEIDQNNIDTTKSLCYQNINYPDSEVYYFHQPRINDCADTSMQMLIHYHKNKCNEIEFHDYDDYLNELITNYNNRLIRQFSGKSLKHIKNYSDMLILTIIQGEDSLSQLRYFLYKHGPSVVRLKTLQGHFALVKGVIDNNVILHDPWKGPDRTISFEKFAKQWDGSIISLITGYSKFLEQEIRSNQLLEVRGPNL